VFVNGRVIDSPTFFPVCLIEVPALLNAFAVELYASLLFTPKLLKFALLNTLPKPFLAAVDPGAAEGGAAAAEGGAAAAAEGGAAAAEGGAGGAEPEAADNIIIIFL
jgi:hypothetical protein